MEKISTDALTRKVQLKAFEALLEFKRICTNENLQYYLIGGSALGAYRHSGFIPWDDDIDIGMPRDDYDKFLEICRKELSNKYYLQNPATESEFVFPFTKIRVNNTIYKEELVSHFNIHHGIFIDIFPLDNVPTSKLLYNFKKISMKFNEFIRVSKLNLSYSNKYKRIIRGILKKYPDQLLKKQFDVILRLGNKKDSSKIGNFNSAYPYGTELMDKNIFGVGKLLEFEGEEFLVPEKIEVFLEKMYGKTFNELPPIEKRITHRPTEISGI